MEPIAQRINVQPVSNTSSRQIGINEKRADKYPRVTYGILRYPECAVVGGGPSVAGQLETLRNWDGDIFGINDTAGYLSDNGIENYIYAIDGTDVPFKIGPLVKGALFATRCHRRQFKQMKGRPIRVFSLSEDKNGVEGGPTAATRTPHLMLSMGYRGIMFFGLDGSFSLDATHVSGSNKWAYDNMIIIRVAGKDYLTHVGLMLQHEWFLEAFKRHGMFLHNASGGLFAAMLENPESWSVVAVAEDLKDKYEKLGNHVWNKEYKGEPGLWQPQTEPA